MAHFCVTFLRHAESLQNVGHLDIYDTPLSENGRRTAQGRQYPRADIVLLSPLKRALQTYSLISLDAKRGDPMMMLQICQDARERKDSTGCFILGEDARVTESDVDFYARVDRLILSIQNLASTVPDARSVLVISHWGLARAVFSRMLGWPMSLENLGHMAMRWPRLSPSVCIQTLIVVWSTDYGTTHRACNSLDTLKLEKTLIVDRVFSQQPPPPRALLETVKSLEAAAKHATEVWFVQASASASADHVENKYPYGRAKFGDANFLGTHINAFDAEPGWYWWNREIEGTYPPEPRLRRKCYCDVMVLSTAGWLNLLEHAKRGTWTGPVEWMLPTIAQPCGRLESTRIS